MLVLRMKVPMRVIRSSSRAVDRSPPADSDDRAHVFRSDAAQRSDLIARR
jgi:hypothetical protein